MDKHQIKVLKELVKQGYATKSQHNNPKLRKALEDAELVLIDIKKNG